jgi:hypothetical protein
LDSTLSVTSRHNFPGGSSDAIMRAYALAGAADSVSKPRKRSSDIGYRLRISKMSPTAGAVVNARVAASVIIALAPLALAPIFFV